MAPPKLGPQAVIPATVALHVITPPEFLNKRRADQIAEQGNLEPHFGSPIVGRAQTAVEVEVY